MAGNLLIVVGAGASKEFGLPIGDGLKNHISDLLNFHSNNAQSGDDNLRDAIMIESRGQGDAINDLSQAARKISDNLPLAISIDNFIDNHAGNRHIELVGKLGIVRAILKAELHSTLYFDERNLRQSPKFGELQNVWLTKFFRLLTEQCSVENLPERLRRVTLIVFNYDRCIEHFMFVALRSYYSLSDEKAAQLVGMMQIYHPYGQVGSLPWQNGPQKAKFGGDPSANELIALARGIKTFTEGTDPHSSEILQIKKQIVDAKIALFLGFAFHRLNLKLLSSEVPQTNYTASYYATAYGLSDSDSHAIRGELANIAHVDHDCIKIGNKLTCDALFHEFSRPISAAYR